MDHHPNIETVRKYLAAIEYGVQSEELAGFFTPDAIQVELPNRLNPTGGESDLPTLLRRAEQGRGLLAKQRYDIISEVASDDRVAVEATWSATLAVPWEPWSLETRCVRTLRCFLNLKTAGSSPNATTIALSLDSPD